MARDKKTKRCIFFLPYRLDERGMGARMLRPRKMIQAFRDIGFEVFVIEGYSKERKIKIKELKKRIKSGEKYDFMYCESSTMPTLLTDPNHLPLHPFMDFGLFKFLKSQNIKIGLFYCDFYWKFDSYGTELAAWKRRSAIALYRYDLKEYKKFLDRFFVPNMECCDIIGETDLKKIASELPPGSDDIHVLKENYNDGSFIKEPLRIFYVGGLGNHYKITELVKAVAEVPMCELTICCREVEWAREQISLKRYMCDRIRIIHKSNEELEEYYKRTDICSLLFQNSIYMNIAIPFKAFEYLAYEKPVLATKDMAIGRFVEKNETGWAIPYDAKSIVSVLNEIISNPTLLNEKRDKCIIAKNENLWITRAEKVAAELV